MTWPTTTGNSTFSADPAFAPRAAGKSRSEVASAMREKQELLGKNISHVPIAGKKKRHELKTAMNFHVHTKGSK